MKCSLFVRNGTAYIPTLAKTEAGYYMDIDPVVVVSVSDSEAFAKSILETIARGHPKIPTPTRDVGFPQWVVPKYAKLKSRSAFEKGATYWNLAERDGAYTIEEWQKREQGGWLPDPSKVERLPPGTSLNNAAQRFVERVQQSLAEGRQ
jgi:hypothetical protein